MQPIRSDDVRTLYQAAAAGDFATLLLLLDQDSRVLDKSIAQGCCTPLHIAAKLGHLNFCNTVLKRKPSFVGIQDFEGSTPLHLAVANGHEDVVKAFLEVDAETCFAKDCRGRNPLHVSIVREGLDEVLKALVGARPEAALALTNDGETILHLCVRNSSTRALCFLVESVDGINTLEFMNTKDCDGFTVLHLAVAEKQSEIIKYLIEKTVVDINKLTTKGYTALDIVEAQSRSNTTDVNVIDILQYNGAVSSKSFSTISLVNQDRFNPKVLSGTNTKTKKTIKQMDWVEKKRNTLMIVASLIATMAYQAGTNPPINVWQEANSHIIQTSFMVYNTAGFLSSLFVILLLISGLPFKHSVFMWILIIIMWAAITSMAIAYGISAILLSQTKYVEAIWPVFSILVSCWTSLLGLLILGHIIRLIVKAIRFMKKKMSSKPDPSSRFHVVVV